MGINDPIRYDWTLGWSGMSERCPTVNPLLKAILDHDYEMMDSLYGRGARLGRCNKATLQRALYHVADDARVVAWLIGHGLYCNHEMRHDSEGFCCGDSWFECVGPDGHAWGLIPRAWSLKSYESMELLADAGCKALDFNVGGEEHSLLVQICAKSDVRAMRLLREYGLDLRPWNSSHLCSHIQGGRYSSLKNSYPDSAAILEVERNPIVKRKGFGLDGWLFTPLEKPELRKPRLFHKKEDERWNQLEMSNYEDRLRAQRAYAARWSPEGCMRTDEEQAIVDAEGELFMEALMAVNKES